MARKGPIYIELFNERHFKVASILPLHSILINNYKNQYKQMSCNHRDSILINVDYYRLAPLFHHVLNLY